MGLELRDTVELMRSSDYKERFIAEYAQLKIRYEKLKDFNTRIEAAMRTSAADEPYAEPKHDCPASLLREQQAAMGEYLHLLEVRAKIENIDLSEIEKRVRSLACCEVSKTPPCEIKFYSSATQNA